MKKKELLADHKSFISSLNILFNKEHDDVSNVYCIPKLHTNQYVAYNTTNASTFSRSQVIHLIIEYSV